MPTETDKRIYLHYVRDRKTLNVTIRRQNDRTFPFETVIMCEGYVPYRNSHKTAEAARKEAWRKVNFVRFCTGYEVPLVDETAAV